MILKRQPLISNQTHNKKVLASARGIKNRKSTIGGFYRSAYREVQLGILVLGIAINNSAVS